MASLWNVFKNILLLSLSICHDMVKLVTLTSRSIEDETEAAVRLIDSDRNVGEIERAIRLAPWVWMDIRQRRAKKSGIPLYAPDAGKCAFAETYAFRESIR
jgi:hypothetical protein